jgi:hypothetical protein
VRSILTVTTAASDLALLTMAELRQATGIATGQDNKLSALGRGIAAAITSHCNVRAAGATPATLRLETLSEVLRLDCPLDRLILARRPIVEIVSVVEDLETVEAEDYEIETGPGFLHRLNDDDPVWWSADKITIAYRAGWETVPENLRNAAMKLATALSAESGRDPSLKAIDIPGVESRQYWVGPADDPLINREIEDLLRDYTNTAMG